MQGAIRFQGIMTLRHTIMLAVLVAATLPAVGQIDATSIKGIVTDQADGLPLPNANVYVVETRTGSVTDAEGAFTVAGLRAGDYTVLVSFTGYQNQEFQVMLASGEGYTLDVALVAGVELDPIQITAGRRQEKALDAPASVDVITAHDMEQELGVSAVKALRNVTGVDFAQTGLDRHEVVLRGFNNVFTGAAYVMTDYRHSATASLGVNLHNIMPATSVDIERIEIVRGPGSALYGPGVDKGVIHYISKDPFRYPGTTLSVMVGERSQVGFEGRVAGVVRDKLGLKVVGQYGRGSDFGLMGCSPELLEARKFSECPDERDAIQLAIDGVERDTHVGKTILNASAEYRVGDATRITGSAGYSAASGLLLSGLGSVRAEGYTYTYGQLRIQSGNLFVQAYLNASDANDSQLYGGDVVAEYSHAVAAQAQYSFQLAGGREHVVLGADLDLTRPDTDETVFGRYEYEDNIDEYGVYLQSSTEVSTELELVAAARADYNNVLDGVRFSPRIGLVFKPVAEHSFRATYNNAYVSPSTTSLFLDLIGGEIPGTGIKLRGRGLSHGYSWERNPLYTAIGAPTDLVASSLIPAQLGAPVPVGLSTGSIYGLLFSTLSALPSEELVGLLRQVGIDATPATVSLLLSLLDPAVTSVEGFSPGVLGLLNLTTQQIGSYPTDLSPIDALNPTTTQVYEMGYKGIFNNKLFVALDGYYSKTEHFVGSLQLKTPFVLVPTLADDLARDLAAGIANNVALAGILAGFGLTPQAVAGIIVQVANRAGGLPDATTPVAIVQPRENNPGVGRTPELLVTYPNFGTLKVYGMDASVQYLVSTTLSVFGNVSWVSDNFFSAEDLGEEDPSLSISLNGPSFKFKFGGHYRLDNGLDITASGRYIQGFPVVSGPYTGDIDDYFVMDAGVGYAFTGHWERAQGWVKCVEPV